MLRTLFFIITFYSLLYSEKAVLQLSEDGKYLFGPLTSTINLKPIFINGFMQLKPMPSPPDIAKDGMVYLSTEEFYLYFNQSWNEIPLKPSQPRVDLTFMLTSSLLRSKEAMLDHQIYSMVVKVIDLKPEDTKPWIQLSWETSQMISEIRLLSNRLNAAENESGKVVFENGDEIAFDKLNSNSPLTLKFHEKESKSIKIHFNGFKESISKTLSTVQVLGQLHLPKHKSLSPPDHITSSSVHSFRYSRDNVLYQQEGEWLQKGDRP